MPLSHSHNASFTLKSGILGMAILFQLPSYPANAQLMDQLKGAVGSGQSSGAGPLGVLGGGVPNVDQASAGNTAGVLQYCIRNNYVSGDAASSVKNSILGKVTGTGQGTNDSGFKAGNSGMLQSGNGQTFSLGGSGAKAQVTHKVCDLVLQHAKSML